MNETENYEYFQKIMKKFDYRTMDTLVPELLEAVVTKTLGITNNGDMLTGLELKYGGAGDSRLTSELVKENIPEDTRIPRYTPNLRRSIIYNPSTGKRLGDKHGLNDWFLFEKEARILEEFVDAKGTVLPKQLLDAIVGRKAQQIEGWNCYLFGLELKKIHNDKLDERLKNEGIDETTLIPIYRCDRLNYIAFHPLTGNQIGGKHNIGKGYISKDGIFLSESRSDKK